jgi:CRP/FNR family transcriptional regulator, cyclic AMP receptor protein
MQANIDLLKRLEFFKDFNNDELSSLSEIAEVKDFKQNETFFVEDQELNDVYVVVEGRAELGMTIANTRKMVIGTVLPGQLLGWSGIIEPNTATAYSMAHVDGKILLINSYKLKKLFSKDCTLGYKFMNNLAKSVSQRLRDTRFQLINLLEE